MQITHMAQAVPKGPPARSQQGLHPASRHALSMARGPRGAGPKENFAQYSSGGTHHHFNQHQKLVIQDISQALSRLPTRA